jgi:cyclophilin family peptidyl-prolyl cis-trans isomerase
MKKLLLALSALVILAAPAQSAKRKAVKPVPTKVAAPPKPEVKTYPNPGEIVAAAKAEEWVAIAPSDLLVMELIPDAKSKARRVIIQLMPAPFSQGWVGNIRKLATAKFWDGTSVNRVQDNYVVQWGDASEKKALPAGLAVVQESEYVANIAGADFAGTAANMEIMDWKPDPYSDLWKFKSGFPIAKAKVGEWPVHCYGMVGVGRGLSPDTGSGAELYTVIGHAPRHLDRNIAVVGRVIEGIENLASLPRGTGPLGFYEKEEERVGIKSIRLVSQLETNDMPRFEYLSTESETFAKYADARANRRDPFFINPAGGADICNIPVPVRRKG